MTLLAAVLAALVVVALVRLRRSRRRIGALEGQVLEVAHDFNNLLTAIRGYSELLVKQSSGRSAEHAREILKASDRAAQITRRLLTFTRRGVSPAAAVDVGDLVRELSAMFRRLAGPGVALEVEVEGRPVAWGDSGALQQVLVNLVVNARDAMPGGGVLRIGARACGPYVLIAVSDTRTAGTVLERSAVQGIVCRQGGFVDVAGEPGAGSTVSVYVPAATDLPAAVSA